MRDIEFEIKELMKELNIARMPSVAEMRCSRFKGLSSAVDKTGGSKFWANKLGLGIKEIEQKWNEDLIKESLLNLISSLNLNRMPTHTEIKDYDNSLNYAVQKFGGTRRWSTILGLSMKTNDARHWTQQNIETSIREVMEILGLSRMPTFPEMDKITGGHGLTMAIGKSGGYKYWHKKLGLELKESETATGFTKEEYTIQLLSDLGFEVKPMTTLHAFDLLVNNVVRVDVKCANGYQRRGSSMEYTFGLNKQNPTCDIYLLHSMIDDEIDRTMIVPSIKLKQKYLTIGKESKYNKYIGRFDYINRFEQFYKSI